MKGNVVEQRKSEIDTQQLTHVEEKVAEVRRLARVLEEFAELDAALATLHERAQKEKIMPLMVPLSEKGMMSGYVQSPLKVTVAIGDNYFIKCDIPKARKILADRRKEDALNREIERTTGVKRRKRKEPTASSTYVTPDGFVNIHEEYDASSDEEPPAPTAPQSTPPPAHTAPSPGTVAETAPEPKKPAEKPSLFKQLREVEKEKTAQPSPTPVSIPLVKPAASSAQALSVPAVHARTHDADRLDHDVVKFDFDSVKRAQDLSRTSPSSAPPKLSKFRQDRLKHNQ